MNTNRQCSYSYRQYKNLIDSVATLIENLASLTDSQGTSIGNVATLVDSLATLTDRL